MRTVVLLVLFVAAAGGQEARPVRVLVAATKGKVIPQSRGGGGFQRSFRFTARPGRANHWIRQVLEVRGAVTDATGASTPAHLDVVEYYRVGSSGRAIQADSHYSQYWDHCAGSLTIRARLTYGTLAAKKRGDTILGKSFLLRSALDAAGKPVTMKKRTTREVIPAEGGERVVFRRTTGSLRTNYTYRVEWDAGPGQGSRTRAAGRIGVGTWLVEAPPQSGTTRAINRRRPIPRITRSR